jgi:hypothetical protein
MKTVFGTTEACVNMWAQQSQDQGTVRSKNVYFEGRTLYSYGSHFRVGQFRINHFTEQRIVLLNTEHWPGRRSHTAWHQRLARQATGSFEQIFLPQKWWEISVDEIRREVREINDQLWLKSVRARVYKDQPLEQAASNTAQIEKYFTFHNCV